MMVLVNKIQTPDGTILTSYHRHDYVEHIDKNGELYFNDGGVTCVRRSINKEPSKDISLTTEDPFTVIREEFSWGTYGSFGQDKFTWVKLCNMSEEHILNIIRDYPSNPHIPLFIQELIYRKENKLVIKDNLLSFSFDKLQTKELNEWKEKIKDLHGEYGDYTYSITPTGIGNGIKVKSHLTNLELDLSHVERW